MTNTSPERLTYKPKFIDRYFGGHITVGRVTVFGRNAMHWAINIRTERWGYVCFRLPFRCFGRWWPLYWYCSPDGTPQAATFIIPRSYRTW